MPAWMGFNEFQEAHQSSKKMFALQLAQASNHGNISALVVNAPRFGLKFAARNSLKPLQ
jgi:hypothetical protein